MGRIYKRDREFIILIIVSIRYSIILDLYVVRIILIVVHELIPAATIYDVDP